MIFDIDCTCDTNSNSASPQKDTSASMFWFCSDAAVLSKDWSYHALLAAFLLQGVVQIREMRS